MASSANSTRGMMPLLLLCLALAAGCSAPPVPTFDPGPSATSLNPVTFSGSEFISMVGLDILRSTDGKRWTRERAPDVSPSFIAASDGSGALVGIRFPSATTSELYYSADGRTWDGAWSGVERVGQVSFGNGLWVGFASSPGRTLLRSTDGRNWTKTELEISAPERLTFAAGRFYLYSGSTTVLTSDDAEVWSRIEMPLEDDMLIVSLEDIGGEVTLLAASFGPRESGSTPRQAAFRLWEIRGTWEREQILLEAAYTNAVSVDETIIGHFEGTLARQIDSEDWEWEPVLQADGPFGNLVVGNRAIVASGNPAAVSLDAGETWSELEEIE